METGVFNSHTTDNYLSRFAEYANALDVYYDPAYLACDASMQKGEFELFTVKSGADVFIYPYIKLPINDTPGRYDITSPYGYAGPFCTSDKLFHQAELAFNTHMMETGCVTEFVRYHYLYNDKRLFLENIQNLVNREMVVMDIAAGWESTWNDQYSVTNRNLVRKLEKEGYQVSFHYDTEHLDAFIDLYESTMRHAGAENFYFFPREYYFNLFERLGRKIFLTRVHKDNHTFSSSLFFESGGIVTYYLSARDTSYGKVPSTNLMLSATVKQAISGDQKLFNLGGGRSTALDDALLSFKKNFYKRTTTFMIGKRIHDLDFYEKLKDKFIAVSGIEKFEQRKHILQFYR